MFVTSHPLFRLPVFIMGVAAALLTLRGVEYPQVRSGILQDIFPYIFPSSGDMRSVTETNPSVWASKTDRSSLLLILVILYTTVNSSCDLKVGLRKHLMFFTMTCLYCSFPTSMSTPSCSSATCSWWCCWASPRMRGSPSSPGCVTPGCVSSWASIPWHFTCSMIQ